AFCPGCGHAFVEEEKRQVASKFERLDPTVQFGQTMYNQMLEDMGLNLSKAPNSPEKSVTVLSPVRTSSAPPVKPIVEDVPKTASVTPAAKLPEENVPAGNAKLYFLIGVGLVFLGPIAVVTAYFLFLDVWA